MTACDAHRDSITDKPYDYIAYMHALKIVMDSTSPSSFLDYSCGKGGPSATINEIVENCEVHGVDISPRNIVTARDNYPMVNFYQSGKDELPTDLGGGMCAFSFACMNDKRELGVPSPTQLDAAKRKQKRAIEQVYGMLAKDALFAIIINNPESIGTRFPGHQVGNFEQLWVPGEVIMYRYLDPDGNMDHEGPWESVWPNEHYKVLMEDIGFEDVCVDTPLLNEEDETHARLLSIDSAILEAGKKIAPYTYIVGRK